MKRAGLVLKFPIISTFGLKLHLPEDKIKSLYELARMCTNF